VVNLRKAVDALNERMMNYEVKNSNVTEEHKMTKIQEDLKNKEHLNEMKKLKDKLAMVTSRRDEMAKELQAAKVKEQDQKEREQKLLLEKDELSKALKTARDRLDQEIRNKEKLQIELNNIPTKFENVKGKIQISTGTGSSGGPTYEHLVARNKELENDIIILQCQQKTVVVYNKEFGTFEYIGEPIYLNHDKELSDIEKILASLRSWLQRNERLTLRSIFESLDKENFGELSTDKFDTAMLKIGVRLRQNEKRILQDILDPRHIGFMRYRPLVKELQGIPQLEFMTKEVFKLAKLVEARDLTEREFKNLIDPRHEESMNLTQMQDSIRQVNNEQF